MAPVVAECVVTPDIIGNNVDRIVLNTIYGISLEGKSFGFIFGQ